MRHCFVCLLLMLLLCVASISAQDDEPLQEYYAYISDSTSDGFVLSYMDMPSLTVARQVETDFWRPMYGYAVSFVSPDGKWVALVPARHSPDLVAIGLFNVATSQLQIVEAGVSEDFYGDYVSYIRGPSPIVAWSPDSAYLAFIGRLDSEYRVGIYDVQNEQIHWMESTGKQFASLAWNTTSTRLAVVAGHCEGICQSFIEVYDVASEALVASRKVLFGYGGFGIAEYICNLQWSPDGQQLSFVSLCGASSFFESPKEVYILDLPTGIVTNATHLTDVALPMTDPPNPDLVGRFAHYNSYWLDANRLLIGAVYSVNVPQNQVASTFVYDVDAQTLTHIGDGRAYEFAVDTVHGQLAITSLDNSEMLQDMRIVPLSAIETFPNVPTFPPGCNLSWNHDGSLLMYQIRMNDTIYCRGNTKSSAYVDAETGILTEFPLGGGPVGWVVMPSQ
ncbi:MAG: hypothetical protein KC615_19315 [Anaerolineae bacterium]|nr:hypothetical protein [Anaerolineae bacterium]